MLFLKINEGEDIMIYFIVILMCVWILCKHILPFIMIGMALNNSNINRVNDSVIKKIEDAWVQMVWVEEEGKEPIICKHKFIKE